MNKLTQKQAETFMFIKEFIKENGFGPTRVDIANEFDINPNAAQHRVEGLLRKGAVTHKKGVMRSLMPVKGYRVRVNNED